MKRSVKSLALILAAVIIIAMFPITASAASNKPGAVKLKSFKVSSVSTSTNTATVTIKWKRASKATGYWVYELQPNGKWKVLKKLGKNYVGLIVSDVPAGSRGFKVCAVRKVSGKTYKGKFAVKKKFIASPLDLEHAMRANNEDTEYTNEYENGKIITSFKGNVVTQTFDMYTTPDSSTTDEIFAEAQKKSKNLFKSAKVDYGVKSGVSMTFILKVNGATHSSETYYQ